MKAAKRMNFQSKLTLSFILLIISIIIAVTYFIYQRAVNQQKKELQNKILSLAKISSLFIDGDKHAQINPEVASQGTLPYKEIKGVLKKIRDVDPMIDSVYTLIKSDRENILIFIVDSGDTHGAAAYCGERYDVSRMPEIKLAFSVPSVDKELTVDKWGAWLSGYAPIYNSKGEAAAIVGLDFSADSIKQLQLLLARRFISVVALGIILSIFLGWLIARSISQPLRSLARGVKQVETGNLRYKFNVKSHDEIEDLAAAFNKMTEGLSQAQIRLQRHYLDTIRALAYALEAKDFYTKGHSERVTNYAVNIAWHLGLSEAQVSLIRDICILHDIGKIGISERILSKPGALSEQERRLINAHPEIGRNILQHIEFLRPGMAIIYEHHERPDGKGYPRGLSRGDISLLASIVAVADAFDAMTSQRPYRQAFSREKAIEILKENAGTQFEDKVVEAFLKSLQ